MRALSWYSAKRGSLQLVFLPVSVFKMCSILTPVLLFQGNSSFLWIMKYWWDSYQIFFCSYTNISHGDIENSVLFPYKPRFGYSWLISPSTHSFHSVFVKECLGRGNVCISCHCMYRGHREFSSSTEVLCKQRIFMIIVIIHGCTELFREAQKPSLHILFTRSQ